MKSVPALAAVMASAFVLPFAAHAATLPTPPAVQSEVRIFSPNGSLVSSFTPFAGAGELGGSVAVGDLGSDGVSELVIGAGAGNEPLVRLFRQDGTIISEFLAYAAGMKSGVNVALCDLTGDGKTEIITGAGPGGGPHVRIFKNDGQFFNVQFFAYDEDFRSGVNVACGDVDGDGKTEIITGAGPGGGPDIKIFDAAGRLKATQTLAKAPLQAGALIFTGNIDKDPQKEILAAPMTNGAFDLAVIDGTTKGYTGTTKFTGFASPSYGMAVAFHEKNVIVANGAFTHEPIIKNLTTGVSFPPFTGQPDFSPQIGVVPETGNLVVLSAPNVIPFNPESQYIKVDISDQRLTAYVNGVEVKSFLVSTGKPGYRTPVGKTTVMAKIPIMAYAWSYGPNNPNNYYLPNVKWNMRVFPHIYIHSAYWHNNFGTPMSHGCINLSIPNAEWIYHWASVGTPVETVP